MSKNVTKRIVKGVKDTTGFLERGIKHGRKLLDNSISTTSHITSDMGREIGSSISDIASTTSSGLESIFEKGGDLIDNTGKHLSNGIDSITGTVSKGIVSAERMPGLSSIVDMRKRGKKTTFIDDVEGNVEGFFDNIYVSTIIKAILVIYAAYAAPRLSRSNAQIFDSSLVRILIAAIIVYVATKDATIAILVSLGFILSLQTAHHYKVKDTSNSVSQEGGLSWLGNSKAGRHSPQVGHSLYSPYSSQPKSIENFVSRTPGAFQKYNVVSESDINRANSNRVPGANQSSTHKHVANTYTTQGLEKAYSGDSTNGDSVSGFIPKDLSSAGVEGDTTLGFAPF